MRTTLKTTQTGTPLLIGRGVLPSTINIQHEHEDLVVQHAPSRPPRMQQNKKNLVLTAGVVLVAVLPLVGVMAAYETPPTQVLFACPFESVSCCANLQMMSQLAFHHLEVQNSADLVGRGFLWGRGGHFPFISHDAQEETDPSYDQRFLHPLPLGQFGNRNGWRNRW